MKTSLALLYLTMLSALPTSHAQQTHPDPPLNHLQFLGSHNSYHIAPSSKLLQFINMLRPGLGDTLNYTHAPLDQQLDSGIRQFEFDLYNDPKGGLYIPDLGSRLSSKPPTNNEVLKQSGFKILHSPEFDTATTVPTLRIALSKLSDWSKAHPNHEPIMVLLELKTESFSANIQPPPFDKAALQALEAEINAEIPTERILTPDNVRGTSPTLREAVTTHGWPKFSQTRGKFIFTLDNEDAFRDNYLSLSPNNDLQNRLCFVSVPSTHPAAAWMKRNDPQPQFDDIRSLVKAGFIVRTRADADLKEIFARDYTRFNTAVSSGAQWISTDADEIRWPDYKIDWPKQPPFRLSPLWETTK